MRIDELFDKPAPYKWIYNTNDYHQAIFEINNKTYSFEASEIDDFTWEIVFALSKGENNRYDSVKITNTGDQYNVFSTVIEILKNLMSTVGVHKLVFSSAEPSRTKLYHKMVDTLLPNWHKSFDKESGIFTVSKPYMIKENKFKPSMLNMHFGGFTGTKIPVELQSFVTKHIKKSKNGHLYVAEYPDSWYANVFQGDGPGDGIYSFKTFMKVINPYFRVQKIISLRK